MDKEATKYKVDYEGIKKRIRKLIEDSPYSTSAVARKIGIPQKTLSYQLKPDDPTIKVGTNIILGISDLFTSISLDWIFKGEGTPYIINKQPADGKAGPNEPGKVYRKNEDEMTLLQDLLKKYNSHMVPVRNFMVNHPENQRPEKEFVPFMDAQEGDVAMPVYGRSMSPTYPSGCYILIREIRTWRQVIEFGEVFLIELSDGRCILKEIRKGKDKNHYKLVSHHSGIDDIEIPLKFIQSIWMVIGKYEKQIM